MVGIHRAQDGIVDDGLLHELQDAIGDAYAIERELGGGGMSHVFLAMERSLRRRVVIKLLPPELVSGVSEARFQREILVTANRQHPHMLPVLAVGTNRGLVSSPSWVSAAYLGSDPLWTPLKKNPRFQPMLAKGATN